MKYNEFYYPMEDGGEFLFSVTRQSFLKAVSKVLTDLYLEKKEERQIAEKYIYILVDEIAGGWSAEQDFREWLDAELTDYFEDLAYKELELEEK